MENNNPLLVTGGTGLVGAHLMLFLCKEFHEITATYHREKNIQGVKVLFERENALHLWDKITWKYLDLTDITTFDEVLQGVKTVFHTASFISFDERKFEQLYKINYLGTQQLIDACIANQVEDFIHISSVAALENPPQGVNQLINEKAEWNPTAAHSGYATTKFLAEMEVWSGGEEGLNVIILNPGIILGKLDGKRPSEKIWDIAQRKTIYVTPAIAAIVTINDVVNACYQLWKKRKFGENYILVSENISYEDLFKKIRSLNDQPTFIRIKKWQLQLAYHLTKLSKILGGRYLSKANLLALTSCYKKDNQKLIKELNFQFESISEFLNKQPHEN